jgi:hypothetical protein
VQGSTRIARLLSLSCALTLGLLACSAETETPEQPADTPSVADPTVLEPEVAPPQGFQRVVLPEEFPQDLPQYPGAVLSDARREPGGGMFVTYESEDATEEVSAFFHEALEAAGWRIETERELMIFASKGTRTFTLLLDDQGDRSWFEIALLAVD